jgi:hypothetical protein
MPKSIATAIIEAAEVRLKSLDLVQSNVVFTESEIPATIKDGSFTVKWADGSLNLDSGGMNRKLPIARGLEIQVFHRLTRTLKGDKANEAIKKAYDVEEQIWSAFMGTRLTTTVDVEILVSSDMQLAAINEEEWFVNTINVDYKYKVTV